MRTIKKNKKGSMAGGVLFLVVLLIGGLVFVTVVWPRVSDGVGGFFDDFWAHLNGGGEVSGYSGIGFVVHYTDGDFDTFGASSSFSLVPLSISLNNRELDSIEIFTKGKLYGENIQSWSAATSQQIEAYRESESMPRFSSTADYDASGHVWADGTVKDFAAYTLEASVLNDVVDEFGDGKWFIQIQSLVDLSVTVNGLEQIYDSLAPSAGLEVKYSDGVPQSMSITYAGDRFS